MVVWKPFYGMVVLCLLPFRVIHIFKEVLLGPWFGEPVFCTPAYCGFCHFGGLRGSRDFLLSSTQPSCLWLSELSLSFSSFVIPQGHPFQTIGLATPEHRDWVIADQSHMPMLAGSQFEFAGVSLAFTVLLASCGS